MTAVLNQFNYQGLEDLKSRLEDVALRSTKPKKPLRGSS